MIRKFALGFLIPPAIMLTLTLGLVLQQTGRMSEVEILAFTATPAIVMVLGWAAVVVNEIDNRGSENQQRPVSFAKFSFFSLLAPAFMLLVGWWAWQAGYISEGVFIFSAVGPAGVIFLAWAALVANEIAKSWSERQQR
jgi:hypothetical protein